MEGSQSVIFNELSGGMPEWSNGNASRAFRLSPARVRIALPLLIQIIVKYPYRDEYILLPCASCPLPTAVVNLCNESICVALQQC